MKRRCFPCMLIVLLSLAARPPSAAALDATITYDPLWDTALLGVGIGGAALEHFMLVSAEEDWTAPDAGSLPWMDAISLFPYHEGYTMVSEGTTYLSMLWPALFCVIGQKEELLPAAAAYAEALSFTFIAKDLLKYAFPKYRPYAYGSATFSGDLLEEADESFPSGHTALAFCAATSFAVLGLELAPDNPATPWLVAGGYGLAAVTGTLRVVSGNHFLVDALAGAALGSGIGWLVTEAHIRLAEAEDDGREGTLGLTVGPDAINVRLRL